MIYLNIIPISISNVHYISHPEDDLKLIPYNTFFNLQPQKLKGTNS